MITDNGLMQEVQPRICLGKMYHIPVKFELTSDTASVTEEILIGNDDQYCAAVDVHIEDSTSGELSDINGGTDEILISIKDETGNNYTQDPIPVKAFARLMKNPRFLGYVLYNRKKYTITVNGTGFPATSVNTYPVRVIITFMCYRLLGA